MLEALAFRQRRQLIDWFSKQVQNMKDEWLPACDDACALFGIVMSQGWLNN